MTVEPGAVGFDADRLAAVSRFFRRYVDDGRLPGWSLLISRHGRVAESSVYGSRDLESHLPIEPDTLFRIYSMTKPITSVAAMLLYEQGAFDLNDPVSRFIPAFAEPRVYVGGPATNPATVPAVEPIRIRHLLTHTSGLTYGFHRVHPVDEIYRAEGFEWSAPAGMDLATCCEHWARLPLLFQPGAEWVYSIATDVLGRVIEVISGQPLDEFFRTRILEPLGMTDTGFTVPVNRRDRLAALYTPHPDTGAAVRYDALGTAAVEGDRFLSGGGGLVGTIGDYHRFVEFLRRGGESETGVRLLGDRTLRYMTRNHLPGGADLISYGRPLFAETRYDGMGFGLGFSVLLDPVANGTIGTTGSFAWGGAASTAFWVDPVEDLSVIFMTQLLPSSTYPFRQQLRQLIYAALT
ncbi:MAG TPA: serine hydrolase domain-containing protein [Kineosporiaceae bacterium]|nr:serine hydrolase domain-containing protein [Kineosporiaceae bacterium]